MSVMIGSPLFLSSAGYQISRSVRLRANTGYLNRTFGASGSTSQWTYSVWTKRGTLGSFNVLLSSAISAATYVQSVLAFDSSDRLWYYQFSNAASYTVNVTSTAVFRDPSAWYHVVMKFDATTSSMIVWVNNQQVINSSSFSTTYRLINSNNAHYIGNYAYQTVDPGEYDGYMTEINFIDGQALTPSSFGQTNATTGVWEPIKYTGTYGTNGFYLNFSDNSAATATTIGKDYSGNGNNWTPNNISLTAGVTYDSMLDVPTQWADGGNGRGNYCTGNPLIMYNGGGGAPIVPKNGNLDLIGGAGWAMVGSTIAVSTGKWYWEATFFKPGSGDGVLGIHKSNTSLFQIVGYSGDPNGYGYAANGNKQNNSTGVAYGATFTNGDVIGVALDLDAGTLTFYKNNTSQGVAFSSLSGEFFPAFSSETAYFQANFGQRPFAYTPPTGFKALNTLNLPTPTILKGNQYFDVNLWTGDQLARTITNSGGMQPDFLWTKSRSFAEGHRLSDSVRGGNGTVLGTLSSNSTDAEAFDTDVTGFTSSGFNIRAGTNTPNVTGRTYVGWQWKAGGTAVTNTAGSITSQVSAGGTQGCSVVTWTGTGANATVGHGLGVAPSMIIFRARSIVENWPTWHINLTSAAFVLTLNTTNAQASVPQVMNSTAPTSSVFSVGTSLGSNGSGTTYVAYLFAAVAGFSAFGSYTGNGSADGTFVFLGFRPRFFLVKRTDTVESWNIIDTARDPTNQAGLNLYPNLNNAESSNNVCDVLSNGVKLRNTWAGANASGGTYIYMAFAENPFKNALAR
jgi:hypothetical protein